jgi:cell division cycle protein 20 (cofactor of APC complex)
MPTNPFALILCLSNHDLSLSLFFCIKEIFHTTGVNTDNEYISSVAWSPDSSSIIIGTSDNQILLWDAIAQRQLRRIEAHSDRVSALSWQNSNCFSSAGRDTTIVHHDIRSPQGVATRLPSEHEYEICGLKWSPDGSQLASGSNSNSINIWDPRNPEKCLHTFDQHTAAVKALAWCPWKRNLLASGGGTGDRTIKFWDTAAGSNLGSITTKAQITSVLWSKSSRELISSHGFTVDEQVTHCTIDVWKYPSMQNIGKLSGHLDRILHTAISPDGTTVVSLSVDETIRFWDVFDSIGKIRKLPSIPKRTAPFDPNQLQIR